MESTDSPVKEVLIPVRMALLVAVTALLPLVWGWVVHRLVARLWPAGRPGPVNHGADARPPIPPITYSI